MGIVLGYSISWAAVVVFIFASGPENHEHSFGLLRWIGFGVVAGAVIGLIIGPITAFKCKTEQDRV